MKKFTLLVVAALLLSLVGCGPSASNPTLKPNPVSDFNYYLNEETQCINITGYVGESANVVIPACIEDLPVRFIGIGSFAGTSVETVVLPDAVEEIWDDAFRGCKSLKTIQFSPNLKKIGYGAFEKCTNLEKVVLPDGLETINSSAFFECTAMKEVVIPGTVKNFGEEIFGVCNSIEKVTFEQGLETIGKRAMFTSEKIKTLVIPSSVKEIKNGTFSFLKLDSITFLGDAPSVGKDEFISCPSNFTIYYDSSTSGWDNTPLSQYNLVAK